VFLVDAITLIVVVVAFAVAGRIVPIIVGAVPRVEDFSEFLQNPLCSKIEDFWHHETARRFERTGLTVQSLVCWMDLQLGFEISVIRDLARFLPHVAGVVVGNVVRLRLTGYQTESDNVPEFAGTPPMPVKHLCHLGVVADLRSVGTVDVQHLKHSISAYILLYCKRLDFSVEYPGGQSNSECGVKCRLHLHPVRRSVLTWCRNTLASREGWSIRLESL
jgi:hypothetical protein